ncbi:MAG: hypothetical protein GEU73_05605 [Chloroflexi bacterium]|nr:hypothetical protein [Chloroflexota bacterium]
MQAVRSWRPEPEPEKLSALVGSPSWIVHAPGERGSAVQVLAKPVKAAWAERWNARLGTEVVILAFLAMVLLDVLSARTLVSACGAADLAGSRPAATTEIASTRTDSCGLLFVAYGG